MQPSHPSSAMPYGVAQHEGSLPEPSNRTATFVLGLLSLFMAQIILGPIAIVLGNKGRKEVAAGQARPDSLLTAGFVMGIIGTCIGAIAIVAVVLAAIFAVAAMPH